MLRKIIKIDEEKCNGCGDCIPGCPEGALRIVDGKARLVGDVYCDGLGACLGQCPEGAILVEEREAADYDESLVIRNIARLGPEAVESHLAHLREHNETENLRVALDFLGRRPAPRADFPIHQPSPGPAASGCPGSRSMTLPAAAPSQSEPGRRSSQLTHWPIQLHLVHPLAPHFRGSDLLLAADCAAFSAGDFHKDYLEGKTLAIACPKLDDGQEAYVEKLTAMIDHGGIRSITVLIMHVPCCTGLLHLANRAVAGASRQVPVESIVLTPDRW